VSTATTRENGSAPTPPTTTTNTSSSSASGPGLQLAPLRGPDGRADRPSDARADIKDDRERRKDDRDREPWGGRGHGLAPTNAPGALGVNRPDRGRKRLDIGTLLTEDHQ